MNGRFCYDCRKHVHTPCRSSREAGRCPNYQTQPSHAASTSYDGDPMNLLSPLNPLSPIHTVSTPTDSSPPDPSPSSDNGGFTGGADYGFSSGGGGSDNGGGGFGGDL